MKKDIDILGRRWATGVSLARERYIEGMRMAESQGIGDLRESIKKHQRAIQKLRKIIQIREAEGGKT